MCGVPVLQARTLDFFSVASSLTLCWEQCCAVLCCAKVLHPQMYSSSNSRDMLVGVASRRWLDTTSWPNCKFYLDGRSRKC